MAPWSNIPSAQMNNANQFAISKREKLCIAMSCFNLKSAWRRHSEQRETYLP